MENKYQYTKVNIKINDKISTCRIYNYLLFDFYEYVINKPIIQKELENKEIKKIIIDFLNKEISKSMIKDIPKDFNKNFYINELIYKKIKQKFKKIQKN